LAGGLCWKARAFSEASSHNHDPSTVSLGYLPGNVPSEAPKATAEELAGHLRESTEAGGPLTSLQSIFFSSSTINMTMTGFLPGGLMTTVRV